MMREPNAATESVYDKEVETLCSKGNQSLSQVVQSAGKAAHGKIQAGNMEEMKQFYEACLLVPGPPDNDLEYREQILPLHLWDLRAGKNQINVRTTTEGLVKRSPQFQKETELGGELLGGLQSKDQGGKACNLDQHTTEYQHDASPGLRGNSELIAGTVSLRCS